MNLPLTALARAASAALLAEIGQILAAFAWVAIYSHLIHPHQPLSAYQAYAQASGPWVSIFAGFPIFYAASRWIAASLPAALAMFGLFVVLDGSLLLLGGVPVGIGFLALCLASYGTKLGACVWGGRHADKTNPKGAIRA